jgi:MFS family permease
MPIKRRAILLWIVVSFLMVLHFFLLQSVGVVSGELRDALNLSALELSFLSSSYLYIYILMQTPAGILLDEFGARKLLTVGAIVCSLGCWLFSNSTDLWEGIIARILMGGGLTFVFISSIQLASRWFAKRYFGLMIGLSEASGMVGAIVGSMLLAVFMDSFGWRHSFALAAALSLVLAALTWLLVRDHPNPEKINEKSKLNVAKVKANLKLIMRKPSLWMHSSYVALMYVSITVFSALWANPFLQRAFDLSLDQSTFACCLVLAGIGLGSPIAGMVFHTEKMQARFIVCCSVLMLMTMSAILYIQWLSYPLICVLMFVLGLSGSSLILCFAIVSHLAPDGAKSTSVGFANMVSLVSAIMFQPVIGWLLNILSDEVTDTGLEYYSATDYRTALSVLPVLIMFAFVVSIFIARDLKPRE